MPPSAAPPSRLDAMPGFQALCAYLRRASGLVIDQDKAYLIETKVMPILRREGVGLAEAVLMLEKGRSPRLAQSVIEAMTVNETYFFRDKAPFDAFRDQIIPWLAETRKGGKSVRIWSAACSSGQEPYSLAMLLAEASYRFADWRVEIVATDLSEAILAKARAGVYAAFDVQRGLPQSMLARHFTRVGDGWRISEALRAMVSFRQLNLLDDYGALGRFDVVFCRNVLIYFDAARKADILSRIARTMTDGGCLVLGAAESIISAGRDFTPDPHKPGCFRKN
ncbi:MAG: protein-glutamate O-methyltransferase CheR [Hyphomicrobiales bacterium]|nr:protein-glutamate O-methyltransferase CheR [Hyphomicrobiales bacterium]